RPASLPPPYRPTPPPERRNPPPRPCLGDRRTPLPCPPPLHIGVLHPTHTSMTGAHGLPRPGTPASRIGPVPPWDLSSYPALSRLRGRPAPDARSPSGPAPPHLRQHPQPPIRQHPRRSRPKPIRFSTDAGRTSPPCPRRCQGTGRALFHRSYRTARLGPAASS